MASSTTTGSFTTLPTPRMAHLRLVDHGGREDAAEAAEIGDGEGSSLHLIGAELAGTGSGGQVHDVALQTDDVLLVGVADHGHDQAVLKSHGHAEVDVAMIDDVGSSMDALTMGNWRSAAVAARITNGR